MVAPDHSVLSLWRERKRRNILPRAGGWNDQPAALLVQLDFIDLVFDTWQYYRSEGYIMEKMSRLQLDLIAWLENDDQEE